MPCIVIFDDLCPETRSFIEKSFGFEDISIGSRPLPISDILTAEGFESRGECLFHS
jgi:hypothetical protein